MKDEPGALAKIAAIFAEKGVSMMYCDAVIEKKGESAVFTVIFESGQDVNLAELKSTMINKGGALKVIMDPF